MLDHRRGQGLDPPEGELLDDVSPLPLGGQLAAVLLELQAPLVEPLPQGGDPIGEPALVSTSVAMVALPSSSRARP